MVQELKLAPGTFQGLHQSEVELFRKVLKGVSGVGVEIGCLDGYSSAVILDASELHLTSIDPFIPDSMEVSLIGSKVKYFENVSPYGDRSELIEGYSQKVRHLFPVQPVEPSPYTFLFIDGDHNYEAASYDFGSYQFLLGKGGILAMHDARMGRDGSPNFHEGPSQVAQERIFSKPDEWEVVGEAFSLVIARKL